MKTPKPIKGYSGWLIPESERARLLGSYATHYPDVFAHHITRARGVLATDPLPEETTAVVIGVADDHEMIQALVCRVGGTEVRPDGGIFHITWSIDRAKGAKPVMSNMVIDRHGWEVHPPITIRIEPTFMR